LTENKKDKDNTQLKKYSQIQTRENKAYGQKRTLSLLKELEHLLFIIHDLFPQTGNIYSTLQENNRRSLGFDQPSTEMEVNIQSTLCS
jgi:hypothetical protein